MAIFGKRSDPPPSRGNDPFLPTQVALDLARGRQSAAEVGARVAEFRPAPVGADQYVSEGQIPNGQFMSLLYKGKTTP